MDRTELESLMRFAVLERARAIAAADKRYQERMQALRQFQELSELIEKGLPAETEPLRKGDVMARVKIAIGQLPEEFSLKDLVLHIRQQDEIGRIIASKAISSAVKRLVGQRVELIQRGRGKRGSQYRRLTVPRQVVIVE